jgi:hypothetical protein
MLSRLVERGAGPAGEIAVQATVVCIGTSHLMAVYCALMRRCCAALDSECRDYLCVVGFLGGVM